MPIILTILLTITTQDPVPVFTNLGSHSHAISSRVPQVQQYFDQGLRLAYAFNHDEAVRAFREAARRDPNCAICWWGVAYSHGPNINLPMDAGHGAAAYDAARRARTLIARASPSEQAYIRAISARYAPNPMRDRARLDSAYARAMAQVAARYPADLDASVLAAEAQMNLRPWNYWTAEGRPQPGIADALSQLESALARDPKHPGACHYYIHAVEAAQPAKAVACAERLAALMPGAGHIVHMPAHIYVRVGRWNDAIEANRHALHADEKYIADVKPRGIYPLSYYPHNHHFLAFAASMAGQSALAIQHARQVRRNIPLKEAAQFPVLQPLLAYPQLTLVTFGRWADVLREPGVTAAVPMAGPYIAYARGVAHAALGDAARARTELATLNAAAAKTVEEPFKSAFAVARLALMGEIEMRAGRLPAAEQHFRAALALEEVMLYTEPPDWYYPVRHSLGAVLLKQNRPEQAERIYREDLKRFPENGWSLTGLATSLRQQKRIKEAEEVSARLRRAWQRADVKPESSRF